MLLKSSDTQLSDVIIDNGKMEKIFENSLFNSLSNSKMAIVFLFGLLNVCFLFFSFKNIPEKTTIRADKYYFHNNSMDLSIILPIFNNLTKSNRDLSLVSYLVSKGNKDSICPLNIIYGYEILSFPSNTTLIPFLDAEYTIHINKNEEKSNSVAIFRGKLNTDSLFKVNISFTQICAREMDHIAFEIMSNNQNSLNIVLTNRLLMGSLSGIMFFFFYIYQNQLLTTPLYRLIGFLGLTTVFAINPLSFFYENQGIVSFSDHLLNRFYVYFVRFFFVFCINTLRVTGDNSMILPILYAILYVSAIIFEVLTTLSVFFLHFNVYMLTYWITFILSVIVSIQALLSGTPCLFQLLVFIILNFASFVFDQLSILLESSTGHFSAESFWTLSNSTIVSICLLLFMPSYGEQYRGIEQGQEVENGLFETSNKE